MKKYILLYKGPVTPPDASHAGWPEWFEKLGNALINRGSPMTEGRSVPAAGAPTKPESWLNGYSIIQAENIEAACALVADHPFLTVGGSEYSIEVFEAPNAS